MEGFSLDYLGIHEYQRDRYPYLMIDHVTKVIPGESAVGYKNLSANDWFFKCHFEGDPNMPGVLQVEALMQMAALAILTLPGNKGKVIYVSQIDNVKLKRKVLPGERLDIKTVLLSFKRGVAKASGSSLVNGEPACSADFTLLVPDIFNKYILKRSD